MTTPEFDWNLATIWETIAEELPDAVNHVHGDRRFTWGQFDRRADGLAATLLDGPSSKDDRVAVYLRNSPEYMELSHAAFKIGIPTVNTNYRYRDEELRYLWEDADVTSVAFHGSYTELIDALRGQVPRVRQWIHVDDGTQPCPAWAIPYEQAAAAAQDRVRAPWGRGGDDLYLMYTGGTTGMPKGVMWRAVDMLRQINEVSKTDYDLDVHGVAPIREAARSRSTGPRHISASPMMHGAGWFGAAIAMHELGTVVSLTDPGLDPEELLDAIDAHQVGSVTIAGEIFAKRIVDAVDAHPGRWDSSSVTHVLNSASLLSEASKVALLRCWPNAAILDGFSSTEGFGMGWSVATKDAIPPTGRFAPGPNVLILDDDGNAVEPGSGVVGKLVVKGRLPLGYYKDPEKSARTFPEIDGVRTAIPGDRGVVNADGTIQLMGRDSLCINTGGEKVFTEEVETVILDHDAVSDVLVLGVPDPEWGQRVTAVVSLSQGAELSADELIVHVKTRLAGYKAPKDVVVVDTVPRAPNGKADYPAARALAASGRPTAG